MIYEDEDTESAVLRENARLENAIIMYLRSKQVTNRWIDDSDLRALRDAVRPSISGVGL